MLDLNSLLLDGAGWELVRADAINDSGWIVGAGLYEGVMHPFLLTPAVATPDSSSAGLCLAGAMAALFLLEGPPVRPAASRTPTTTNHTGPGKRGGFQRSRRLLGDSVEPAAKT